MEHKYYAQNLFSEYLSMIIYKSAFSIQPAIKMGVAMAEGLLEAILASATNELSIMATYDRDRELVAEMRWRWRLIGGVLAAFEKEYSDLNPEEPPESDIIPTGKH